MLNKSSDGDTDTDEDVQLIPDRTPPIHKIYRIIEHERKKDKS